MKLPSTKDPSQEYDVEYSGLCSCRAQAYRRLYPTVGEILRSPLRRCRTCRRGCTHCDCPYGPCDPVGR